MDSPQCVHPLAAFYLKFPWATPCEWNITKNEIMWMPGVDVDQ